MAITIAAQTRVTIASGTLTMPAAGTYTVATDDYVVFAICSNTNGSNTSHTITKASGTATIGTVVEEVLQQSGGQFSIYYVPITVGGTISFASTNGTAFGHMSCAPLILTGVDTAAPKDAEGQGGSATNAIDVGATTVTANTVLVVGGTEWNDLGNCTSSDLTDFTTFNGGGSSMSGGSGWKAVASTGAATGNLDAFGAAAADWDWGAVAFKAAGGVAPAATVLPAMRPPGFRAPMGQRSPWTGSPASEATIGPPTDVSAEAAETTATAEQPAAAISVNAEHSAVTASAELPIAAISINAENAAATAAALDATVSTAIAVNAAAEVAQTTATAEQASPSIQPNASNATATATAEQPASSVTSNAQNAATTTTAEQPAPSVAAAAGSAATTGTAEQPTLSVAPIAASVEAIAVANGSSAAILVNVENAAAAAVAFDATISTAIQVFANAQAAETSGTANNAAASVAATTSDASAIALIGAASASVAPPVELAAATASAFDATVSIAKLVFAEAAEVVGIAYNSAAAIAVVIEVAEALAEAFDVPPQPIGSPSLLRVWRVLADDRTLAPVHDRRITLPANTFRADNRTLVDTDDRRITTPADTRTIIGDIP